MRIYQDYLYKICKEHYPKIIQIAKYLIDRNKNEYDNQVAIEGSTGSGKSMFSLVLTMVCYHMLRREFNIEKQMMFIPTENQLRNAIPTLQHCDHYIIDEAIRALDKHFWYKLDQIEINQLVKTDTRRMELSMFYNIQRFRELTESFRNHNIQTRIFILKRAFAIMYIRDDDKDIDDPWHTKTNINKKSVAAGGYNYQVALTIPQMLERERKCTGYYLHTEMPDISSIPDLLDVWNYYKALKNKSRDDAEREREAQKENPKTRRDNKNKLSIQGLMKQSHLEDGLHCAAWINKHEKYLKHSKRTLQGWWREMLDQLEDEKRNG